MVQLDLLLHDIELAKEAGKRSAGPEARDRRSVTPIGAGSGSPAFSQRFARVEYISSSYGRSAPAFAASIYFIGLPMSGNEKRADGSRPLRGYSDNEPRKRWLRRRALSRLKWSAFILYNHRSASPGLYTI